MQFCFFTYKVFPYEIIQSDAVKNNFIYDLVLHILFFVYLYSKISILKLSDIVFPT